jgi:hypothetical protein
MLSMLFILSCTLQVREIADSLRRTMCLRRTAGSAVDNHSSGLLQGAAQQKGDAQRGRLQGEGPVLVRLHGTFVHTGTVSGRLSMDSPNLQVQWLVCLIVLQSARCSCGAPYFKQSYIEKTTLMYSMTFWHEHDGC